MNGELVLIDRESLLVELQYAFDAKTAEVLLGVLDKVAAQVHASGVTREDFSELKQIVKELGEAQRRTEEQIKELAEAQRRTEKRVSGLETAVEKLEVAVERLVEEQQNTSQAVRELAEGLKQLRQQVGSLSDTVGGDIEDIAYIVLHDVLKREFGWDVGVLERRWQKWGNRLEEVDVFGTATDPAKPEKKIWIVGEAKHNLTATEVKKFINQVARARQHLVGEIFPVCFCYRARPEVQQQVQDAGIRLVFSYGKLV
ncbi:hypothetical protein H8E77_24225 [bacterium]|nr:hypothetical protein [bacterium]